MFGKAIQAWGRRMADRVVGPLARTGITPNMLTVVGLLLSAITALIIAQGWLLTGGVMLLVAGLFDMLDGALARVQNSRSTFGAFFDSTLDRLAEAGVGLGLAWFYIMRLTDALTLSHNLNNPDVSSSEVGVLLVFVMIVGSLMISYARARAEGLGLECKVGLVARPERVAILAAGLLLGRTATMIAVAILAAATISTTLQRIYHVWAEIREAEAAKMAEELRRTASHKQARAFPTASDGSGAGKQAEMLKKKRAVSP